MTEGADNGICLFLQKPEQMKSISIIGAFALGFLLIISCKDDPNKAESPIEIKLAEIKDQYAPDKRVALFDVTGTGNNEEYVLRGETNLPDALAALKRSLSADSIAFVDSIQVLPADYLGKNTKAIVNVSVANLRSNPAILPS